MFFRSPKDIRFQQNHDTEKTLQNKFKMRDANAFAQSNPCNYLISIGNCNYFWVPGFVAERLCGRLANTAHGRGHVRIITLRLFPAAAAEWAKPGEIRRGTRLGTAGAGEAFRRVR